mgnify:CR=1 FL=1
MIMFNWLKLLVARISRRTVRRGAARGVRNWAGWIGQPVSLGGQILEDRMLLATFVVDILVDENDGNVAAGDMSLREAILQANSNPGADEIHFNTALAFGPGLHTITLTSALPAITGPVTIDGTSQPRYVGVPLININGNSMGGSILNINNSAAIGTIIKGLKFSGNTGVGIRVTNVDDVQVIDLDLSDASGNYAGQVGISVENGSDNVRITGVTTTGAGVGIQIIGSDNPTIQNNTLSAAGAGLSTGTALYLDNVTGFAIGSVSDNNYAGSDTGLRLANMTGLLIGDASIVGANIVLPDGAVGLGTVSGFALRLQNLDNSTIDNLDLSWTGSASRTGRGIFSDAQSDDLIVQNVTATNRSVGMQFQSGQDLTVTNNTLSNNDTGLYVDSYSDGSDVGITPLSSVGNVVSNSSTGLQFFNMSGLAGMSIGITGTEAVVINATDGLKSVTGRALYLRNLDSLTLSDLDLAYTGTLPSGTGLYTDGSMDDLTIQNVVSRNRNFGIEVIGATDLTLLNNTLTNNNTALRLRSISDGADANTVPVVASGNVVTGSSNGFNLSLLPGQFVGTAGTGIIINNATDGFTSLSGTALLVTSLTNGLIDGLDLSWSSAGRVGTGIGTEGDVGTNLVIQNINASNRNTGVGLTAGGSDLTLNSINVSNSNTGMRLFSFRDGGDTNTVPIVASGNIFTNSSTGLELHNNTAQFIGTSGAGILINNATDGLQTTSIIGIYLRSGSGVTIDGLDVSYAGGSRTGSGILADQDQRNLTIQNVIATNRSNGFALYGGGQDLTINNNNLSNNNTALQLFSFSDGADLNSMPVVGSGNVFENSSIGIELHLVASQFIGTSGDGIIVDNATAGLDKTTTIGIYLRTGSGVTIDGLDLSFAGGPRTGSGIVADQVQDNLTIQNVTATNRGNGFSLYGSGQDLTVNNNILTNDDISLRIDFFTDGADADSAPFQASGNNFATAATAWNCAT